MSNLLHNIFTVSDSKLPKYQQIINHVIEGIRAGQIRKDQQLPSINQICKEYNISRDTVVKAYNHLREKGIIASVHGKGYYISNDRYQPKIRVFVLFDVLYTAYKEQIYEGLKAGLDDQVELDLHFHHQNIVIFNNLISKAKGNYAYYVIIPPILKHDKIRKTLSALDQDKLLLLDIRIDYPGQACAAIWQSHNEQLEKALNTGIEKIKKYKTLMVVIPEGRTHPPVILQAMKRFCAAHQISLNVISKIKPEVISHDQLYFLVEDIALVDLVKVIRQKKMIFGRDIGCIAYNETPLKEIIEGGITTVSIDFYHMGKQAAYIIQSREKQVMELPTRLILRNSV